MAKKSGDISDSDTHRITLVQNQMAKKSGDISDSDTHRITLVQNLS